MVISTAVRSFAPVRATEQFVIKDGVSITDPKDTLYANQTEQGRDSILTLNAGNPQPSGLPVIADSTGIGDWIKANPLIAGGAALGIILLVMTLSKKNR